MEEIKACYTIELQGSTKVYKEDTLKSCHESTKRIHKHQRAKVEDTQYVPAYLSNTVTPAQFYAMTDNTSCPEWSSIPTWKKLSKKERFFLHLERIAWDNHGKVSNYHIFEN